MTRNKHGYKIYSLKWAFPFSEQLQQAHKTFNEKQLTYQNNRGFQSSRNTKPRQIITSILYMIFYATECVRVRELHDIEAQSFFFFKF